MEILRCRGICKKFGGVQALSKVSMGFPEGEITGIIGTNGAGKTTLFNLLSGFLKPDGGTPPTGWQCWGSAARFSPHGSFNNTHSYKMFL